MADSIKIEEVDELSELMLTIDKQIKDDAFSGLGDLPENEKQEIFEKYQVTAWKYLFAKKDEKYVGRVVLDRRNLKLGDKKIACVGIGGVAVSSAFQKKGIGKMLMNQVVELCKRNSIDLIFLNAGEDLRKYYENFGFILYEYIIKGFAMDDERLKQIKHFGVDYFDELFERIREIRLSERRLYQKITDIYALSADYDSQSDITKQFFATVQNKLHWAITGTEQSTEVDYCIIQK